MTSKISVKSLASRTNKDDGENDMQTTYENKPEGN